MHTQEAHFSDYGHSLLTASPVSQLMASFARTFRPGIDINMGVGFVNEQTLPYDYLSQAIANIVGQPEVYRNALNYGDPAGTSLLRARIREMLSDALPPEDQPGLAQREVVIGTTGATSILESLVQIFKPGLVIMADPVYYIYRLYLERKGFKILGLPEDKNGLNPDQLEQLLYSSQINLNELRFIYLITVSNPTSTILTNERKHRMVRLINRIAQTRKIHIPVIFDQAYTGLIHDPEVEAPDAVYREDLYDLVYEVGTLSKILSPSFRLGYVVGKPTPLLAAIQERNSDVGFSASPLNQYIAAFLVSEVLQSQQQRVLQGYRDKAPAIMARLDQQLAPFLESYTGGRAGFYFYLTFKDIQTHPESDFYRYLNRCTGNPAIDGEAEALAPPRLAYIPGSFCVLPDGALQEPGRRSLRISYGFESMEPILKAIDWMAEAARYAISRR